MRTLASILLLAVGCGSSPSPAPGDSGVVPTQGYAVGNTFQDVSLVGYSDKNHDGALSPDEDGSLTAAGVIAANPKAEVLLVHVAFGWCKFCWEETAEQLKMTAGYGGRFISIQILVEDRDGIGATKAFVDEWLRLNKSAMVTTLEPEGSLLKRFGRSATYLLLDPKDMKVLVVGAGPPTFAFVRTKITERLGPLTQ